MTANEMIPAVGQEILVRFEDIRIQCVIRDVKFAYGRPLFDVEPIAGDGRQWVSMDRLLRRDNGAVLSRR
jgi:hypothetical protein